MRSSAWFIRETYEDSYEYLQPNGMAYHLILQAQ